MTVRGTAACLACLLAVCAPVASRAQTLPSEPIAFGDGRVTISGDVAASFGLPDPGFFNYTDYEHSALRLLRIDVAGAVHAGEHFSVLGELRSENFHNVWPYALYLRIRPWTARNFDIQVGRVPPTFGAFSRRLYASDNPLIGYPLAYQYLTSLRPDALPASSEELLRRRGTGWRNRFTIGSQALDRGVPLTSAFRWDTGVQVHGGNNFINGTASVTAGTVSNPLFSDDNSGRQFAGRVEIRPVAGLVVGTSLAQGPFVSDSAVRAAVGEAHDRQFTQTAWGGDFEYSRDYYLIRFETIVSDWRIPIVAAPELRMPLRAVSTSIEGRYKLMPGLYLAARADHIGFSDISGFVTTAPWDAPVTRIEVGGGFSIQRNLLLKVSGQYNERDGGPLERQATLAAVQLVFWF
jgi:hypothetical protein